MEIENPAVLPALHIRAYVDAYWSYVPGILQLLQDLVYDGI